MSFPKASLGEIADVNWGDTSVTKASYVTSGYPAFSATGSDGFLPYADHDRDAIVLSAIGARCGKTWFTTGKWSCIKNTIRFWSTHSEVDNRYLYWATYGEAYWPKRGAAQPFITIGDARRMKIALPPLSEQRHIAAILDQAEALRAKRSLALAQLDKLAQAIFVEMFGDPVTNSKGWPCGPLSEAVDGKFGVKAGPFGSALKKDEYTSSGYRIYGQEQVIAGRFDIGDYYISQKKFQQLHSCAVAPGDLLFSLVGSFGKVLEVPEGIEPGIINPRLLKITPNRKLLKPQFLADLLQHPSVQTHFEQIAHGGTMGILNAGLLKQLNVILPPLELQLSYLAHFESLNKLRKLQVDADQLNESLFRSIQHRAFRGEL